MVKIRDCKCETFQKNIKYLDAVFVSASIHGAGYKGEPLKFCPWCGKEMK